MTTSPSALALEVFAAAGDRSGKAASLNNIGWYQATIGDYSAAVASCHPAVGRFHRLSCLPPDGDLGLQDGGETLKPCGCRGGFRITPRPSGRPAAPLPAAHRT